MNKDHPLCPRTGFKVTAFMQSMICTLGQHAVFESASGMLKKFFGVDTSAKQIQRISEYYGEQIEPIIEANQEEYIPSLPQKKQSNDTTYVMLDGTMVFTRDEGWKEMKLARAFNQSKNISVQQNRKQITQSIYVSHLGTVEKFLPKLERHINSIKNRKVFVADGAKWIWKWVEDNYPGSTQILDYYHAVEKLGAIARHHIRNPKERKGWLEQKKKMLLNDKVYEVIQELKKLRPRKEEAKEAIKVAINYYTENEDRMLYKTYKEKGLLIGSGPMESAHRNVIHKRMKLSGQRWSKKGANAIANLRCYNQSDSWGIIENLIKLAA